MELDARVREVVPGSGAEAERNASGPVLVVQGEAIRDVMQFLRDDPELRYDMLVDVTAVDYRPREGRFHVVYLLASLPRKARLTVKVKLAAESPALPSIAGLWHSANWAERETYDMFGITFEGHPDLRRILMYPEFEGYPLRKDYPVEKRQPLVEERDPITNPWPSRDGL
jgi:NADH-quinone oxidoreductase subunit C